MFERTKIPKIWLSYDRVLIESYIPDFSNEDYIKFKNGEKIAVLNSFLEESGEKLLRNISKLSGVPWHRKEIPVYLIPNIPLKSFSHPLVLIARKPLEQRLIILAHELVHINLLADRDTLLIGKKREAKMDLPNIEAVCWLIGKKALENTVKDWREYEEWWRKILTWDKTGKTKQEIEKLKQEWDYKKDNFKKFYNKKTQPK